MGRQPLGLGHRVQAGGAMSGLLWVDVETTGLDPEVDDLLQVGMAITGANLSIRVAKEWVVWRVMALPFGDKRAEEMHGKSGLRRLAQEFGRPIKDVHREIAA